MEQAMLTTFQRAHDQAQQMTDEERADAIDDAADYIEKRGWTQREYQAASGEVCAVGALRKSQDWWRAMRTSSYPTSLLVDRRVGVLSREVLAHLGLSKSQHSLETWNDSADRKRQDVLDAFRDTAKDLRRKADGNA